jgi:hypothetical protein
LIAGFLGLPAAFLIVNLAAERAIKWGQMSRWQGLQIADMADVRQAWRWARPEILWHYSLAESLGEAGQPARFEPEFFGISTELTPLLTSGDKEFRDNADTFREVARTVEHNIQRLESERLFEVRYRERLKSVLLPRIESRTEDPELVARIRRAEDCLLELERNWNGLRTKKTSENLSDMHRAANRADFPNNVTYVHRKTWGEGMLDLIRFLGNPVDVLESMDSLVSYIESYPTFRRGRKRSGQLFGKRRFHP